MLSTFSFKLSSLLDAWRGRGGFFEDAAAIDDRSFSSRSVGLIGLTGGFGETFGEVPEDEPLVPLVGIDRVSFFFGDVAPLVIFDSGFLDETGFLRSGELFSDFADQGDCPGIEVLEL
jgi:hypothetical protein